MDTLAQNIESLPIGKITFPRQSAVFLRKRLFTNLDQACKNRPILWVSAPAGSGKTTLFASYVSERKLSCLWYQVDVGDGDLGSFFFYMGLAGKKAAPRRRRPLPLLMPEYLLGLPAFSKRYFRDLFSRIKTPGLLVLDNYQDAPANSLLDLVIQQGLSEIPEGINVIIASREDPPAAMAHLRGSDAMSLLTWDDLRLTIEETRGLCLVRGKKSLSKESMANLQQQTDGWAAGLVLMLEKSGEIFETIRPVDPPNREVIFDYFAGEIFQRANKETQKFLTITALLPRFTVTLAEELTQMPEANRILSSLTKRNYFTVKHAGPVPAFEYHPLFRDFLLTRTHQTIDHASLKSLKRRAGELLVRAGEIQQAIELLQESEAWDSLERLIREHAENLLAQGRNQLLEQMLRVFPEAEFKKRPWLEYWLGVTILIFDPLDARNHLEKAYLAFETKPDRERAILFLTCSAACDSFIYHWGDFKPADRWIERIQRLMEKGGFPSDRIEDIVAPSMFGVLMWRAPDHRDRPYWHELASNVLLRTENPRQRVYLAAGLLDVSTWLGDPAATSFFLEICRAEQRKGDLPPIYRLWAMIAETIHAWIMNETHRCRETVASALAIAEATDIHLFDFAIMSRGVYGALGNGDLGEAGEYLQKMSLLMDRNRLLDVAHYHYLSGWYSSAKGETRTALEHARKAVQLGLDVGTPYGLSLARLGLAQLLCEVEEFEEADQHLESAMALADGMKSNMLKYLVLLIQARYDPERGMSKRGLKTLRRAFALGSQQGLSNTPWWRSDIMTELCIRALENDIESDYTLSLIRRRHLIPANPPIHLDNWPWALKIFTLGRFSINRDGKPIGLTGRKVQHRPLELLKALISFGGRDVSQERLIDALWPDAEGDLAHRTFETTLHRLRKLFGIREALVLSDGRLSLDNRLCWVDVWFFERLLTQAEEKLKPGGPVDAKEQIVELTRKVFSLYHGPFLGDANEAWIFSLRERLRMRFLRGLSRIGLYYEKIKAWEQAIECYQNGVEIDSLAEVLYQRLMVCYLHLGRQAEALSVYQRCRQELEAALMVEPSVETEAIYRTIRSGDKTAK